MKKIILGAVLLLGATFAANAKMQNSKAINNYHPIEITTSCGTSATTESSSYDNIYDLLNAALALDTIDCGNSWEYF